MLKKEIDKLRSDIEEKDKKIRELTIRLDARKNNKFGNTKDMDHELFA